MPPAIVVTHSVHAEVTELLSQVGVVVGNPTPQTLPRAEIMRRCRDAEALLAFMPDVVDREFIEACRKLKIVAAALKGFDNFDVPAMTERGIWFTMERDLLTIPTAELAITLLLNLARRVVPGDRFLRSGQFSGWRPQLYGAGLSGSTVGIIGMGAIGQAIARRLAGFDAELLYFDRQRLAAQRERDGALRFSSLNELLTASDFIILAVPLSKDTWHLIDGAALRQTKPGAYLINICRGSVVDETAVAAALDSGALAGYAADVFEMEDSCRPDHPQTIPQSLIANQAQTLFTPHLGSAVAKVRRQIELRAAQNILQALRGERPSDTFNVVRPNTRAK